MATLDEWLTVARGIHDFYFSPEGLQRFPGDFNIPEVANWLYHWREEDHDLEWIKQAIRDDQGGEWRMKHPGGSAPGPITPSPASPSPEPSPLPIPTPIPDPNPQPVPAGSVRVIQVTNESDGELSQRIDASRSRAFIAGSKAYVFVGHADGRPRFFSVDILSGAVERLGPLVGFTGTSEDWYFDADGWIYLLDGPRLRRVSPFTGEARVVFDISDSHPGCDLWQPHSSDDGTVHSATIRDAANPLPNGKYPYIKTLVVQQGHEIPFPAVGDLDESQVTPDGGWIVIKETLEDGLSNRIINLRTRETTRLRKADGAVGHSDCGPGMLVGEWSPPPGPEHGQCVKWDLTQPLTPGRRMELFPTWNMGHVSVRGGRCLLSDQTGLGLVSMQGGGVVYLLNNVMPATDYDHQLQAPLDPTGRVACYMLDQGGRWDLFLAVLPA